MLEFHPLHASQAAPERVVELLQQFRALLATDGMADMDEYGDMLKWALPSQDGWCRYFHAYHESFCSWDDRFYGTIHDHGGIIRGTILLGGLHHQTYAPTPNPEGTHQHKGTRYDLKRHVTHQEQGTQYELAPRVPHWPKPIVWTVTYFEEEDNGEMGDLVHMDTKETDTFTWEQEDANRRLPELLAAIDAQLDAPQVLN